MILNGESKYSEKDGIPLAIAATELGIPLNKMLDIISEKLIETCFNGEYKAGARVSRKELNRALDIGRVELVRIAEQSLEEIFQDAVEFLQTGNLESAEKAYDRMDKFDFRSNYSYTIACGIGIKLVSGNFESLSTSFWFVDNFPETELVAILSKLQQIVAGIKPKDHLSAVVREQILAVAEGKKLDPFDHNYASWQSSEYFSKMDKNQRHAMMLSSVVLSAIDKYNFKKQIHKWNGFTNTSKDEELEKVVRNAIYTALEAEDTYHTSPSSKLFVDKFVEFFPKRWVPAEKIVLLPKNEL